MRFFRRSRSPDPSPVVSVIDEPDPPAEPESTPPESPEASAVLRWTARVEPIIGFLTATTLVLFGVLYALYGQLLAPLGLTPEQIGMGELQLLSRAIAVGGFVLPLFLALILMGWSGSVTADELTSLTKGMPGDRRLPKGLHAVVRGLNLTIKGSGGALSVALAVALGAFLLSKLGWWPVSLLIATALGAFLHRLRRPSASRSLVSGTLVLVILLVTANLWGDAVIHVHAVGQRAIDPESPTPGDLRMVDLLVGLDPQPVTVRSINGDPDGVCKSGSTFTAVGATDDTTAVILTPPGTSKRGEVHLLRTEDYRITRAVEKSGGCVDASAKKP